MIWAVLLFLAFAARFADAQVALPAPQTEQTRARLRLGGILLDPAASISSLGVDTNVFNTLDDPQSDFTFTISPALNAWTKIGRVLLRGRGQADMVYFQTFSTERSIDGGGAIHAEVALNRIKPWFEAGNYSGRQRVGYEIDLRSRRNVVDLRAGVNLRTGAKTALVLGAARNETTWAADAFFLGNSLREALNRRFENLSLSYRHDLSVLTTLVVEGSGGRTHFDYFPSRNTDTYRVQGGFDLKPDALVSGAVRVGYQQFIALRDQFDSFRGLSLNADAGYVFRGGTQLTVQASRDTDYSFERDYPYYLRTGLTGTATQRLTGRWDAQVRAGRQALAYRRAVNAVDRPNGRTDTVRQLGFGVGFRINRDMRIALNGDHIKRVSPLQHRAYQGLRFGGGVTYAR